MQSFWTFFIRKGNFAYLLLIALVAAGLFSVVSIPKESAPEVEIPVGIVSVALPGAAAADVETLITNKIEDQLSGGLDNVSSITSVSSQGIANITIEFDASADLDAAIQDLKDEIDKVKPDLPEEATDPVVSEISFVNQPVVTYAVGGNVPEQQLIQIADDLSRELRRIPGVSDVEIGGERDREVQVVVRKEALATYGLSLTDVANAIGRASTNLPVGSIEIDGVGYAIRFEGDIDDPSEVRDLPILVQNGAPIYVRDVADVYDGLSERASISRVSVNGEPSQPSLSISVFKRTGGNITAVTDAVNERLAELSEDGGLLDGLTVLSVYDAGDELRTELLELSQTGLETIVLVLLVLFLTIGWREAIVAGLSIPLSFVIAFIGLYASGNTLNFVSLFSLILAVGILVDAGIVIAESMATYIAEGRSKRDAAFLAIKTYHSSLTAGILTTVAVFIPLFFISGVTGEFIATIPFTIIFVLLASLFVALSFVPLIGISFLKKHDDEMSSWQDRYMERARQWYRGMLSRLLVDERRAKYWRRGLIISFFVALSFPILGIVEVVFFPPDDIDFVLIDVETPQGTALEYTDLEMRKIEEVLLEVPAIASYTLTVGGTSQFGTSPASGSKFGNFFVNLEVEREVTSSEAVADLRERLAHIQTSTIRVSEPSSGPPVGTPVVIKFLGDDLDTIERLADEASRILEPIPGTANITTSTLENSTEFVLTIDKGKAAALGVTPAQVAQILRTAVEGTEATSIEGGEEDIDVVVTANLNPDYRDPHDTTQTTIDTIRNLTVPTQNGPVILGTFTDVSVARSNSSIRHEEAKRVATAGSQLAPDGNARQVVTEFRERAAQELSVPPEVTMEIGGENEEVDQSFAEMFYALIAGIVLMLAVLMFEFNSWRHSFYVLSVIPLTLIGIMIGLAVTQSPLSFPSLLGVIALSGVIVNHSILLIDIINQLRHERPDAPIRELIIEGSVIRLRPIMLTNITTIIGMVPLALRGGIWAPLAFSIMFGLTFAAVITLVLIPLVYDRKPGALG